MAHLLLGEWQSCRVIIFVLFCRMHAVVVVVLHVRGSWAYLGYGSTKVESFCDREQYFFANELECIFNIYSEMSIFLYPFEFLRVMCNFIIRCYYMFSERGKKNNKQICRNVDFPTIRKFSFLFLWWRLCFWLQPPVNVSPWWMLWQPSCVHLPSTRLISKGGVFS